MTKTPNDLAAVEQLLAERDAIYGWLARLDLAGTAVPDSVRSRVRRDYEVRMEGLTDRLRVHADTVAGKLADGRAEHADLEASAVTAREALAEVELRHLVGEFEEGRYTEERTRHSSDLETFELSLAAAAEQIGRLEELYRVIAAAPKVAPAQATLTPPAEPAQRAAAERMPAAGITAEPEVEEEVAIDDLAPESIDDPLAVFDEDDSIPSLTVPTTDFAPLSFRPSGSAASEPARPVTPPLPRHQAPLDDPLFGEEIIATGPPQELAANIVGRTLRCGECGAMNRPLEWYCEKCGAELTSL